MEEDFYKRIYSQFIDWLDTQEDEVQMSQMLIKVLGSIELFKADMYKMNADLRIKGD